MKQNIAVEQFLAGRRVVIARFVAHRHKEVQNKAKKGIYIQCYPETTHCGIKDENQHDSQQAVLIGVFAHFQPQHIASFPFFVALV